MFRSEVGILVHTALLSCSLRHTHSPLLLEELVNFLLGSDTHSEQRDESTSHNLRYFLIEHCNHISDEVTAQYYLHVLCFETLYVTLCFFAPVLDQHHNIACV